MKITRLDRQGGEGARRARSVLIVAAALALCALSQAALAAPTATLQGTDDHDTQWRVGNLADRLRLMEQQATAGQDLLFMSNCRHMDDSLFTIRNRLAQLPDGDQVRVVISHSPAAAARAALDQKQTERDALVATGVQYNNAIAELDRQLASGVRTFQLNWLKALFGQLKPAIGLPKVYEIPTEFWNWYKEAEQAGQILTENVQTINNLSQLRDILRQRQREVLDRAHEIIAEIDAEQPRVTELENAFDSVIAKYPFVIVGDAPPVQAQQAPEVSICFLVDVSGSMAGRKLADAREAVRASVARTDDGKTEWALVAFGGCRVHEVIGFTQSATAITDAVAGLSANGDTPMTYAMYKAAAYVAKEGRGTRSRRMIVLCDGQDNCSERNSVTQEEAMEGLRTIIREIPVPAAGGIRP
ncbi:MAG: vWA domain-containing protein [Armatimonadota bacterium]